MDYGLAGKVVVITGAGSGIGLATAQAFVTEGASVVAGDLEPGGLAQVAGPGRVTVVTVDLARAEGPATLADTALRVHGRVDVLVNNVWGGYAAYHEDRFADMDGPFWTVPLSVWDDMFVAGVRAHYVASVLAVPLMGAAGLIVNISFFPGTYLGDDAVAYSVA
jgi:NAD(P)-dependent dehydrogenase (short-subunit alcohol dehydrogenase family)